jgi:hypothetical protein
MTFLPPWQVDDRIPGVRNRKSNKRTRVAAGMVLLAVALLGGCATTPVVEAPPEPTPYDRHHLLFQQDGFVDTRSGWYLPQRILGSWVASQAWEFEKTVTGIEYVVSDHLLELATRPAPLGDEALASGTVAIAAYARDYSSDTLHPEEFLGSIPGLMGLGNLKESGIEEFWAYQNELENKGYNLWKLVKLQQGDSSDRVFHSQLVLQKVSGEKSIGMVVTVGTAADTYVVILIRREIIDRDGLSRFGEWAYAVLRELDLTAIKE